MEIINNRIKKIYYIILNLNNLYYNYIIYIIYL